MQGNCSTENLSDFDKQKIAIYLEEYKSCRDEIKQSLVFKYNFYILEYGFFGALASFLYKEFYSKCPYTLSPLAHSFLLTLPFLFYFISFTYLQSHIRVCQNAKFIQTHINSRIDQIIPNVTELFEWESYLFVARETSKLRTSISILTSELITHVVCPFSLILLYFDWLYSYKYPITSINSFQRGVLIINAAMLILTVYCKMYTLKLYRSILDGKILRTTTTQCR